MPQVHRLCEMMQKEDHSMRQEEKILNETLANIMKSKSKLPAHLDALGEMACCGGFREIIDGLAGLSPLVAFQNKAKANATGKAGSQDKETGEETND